MNGNGLKNSKTSNPLSFNYINFFYSQVSDIELSKMTSLSSIQTKGLKRQFAEEEWMAKMTDAGTEIEKVIVNKEYGELSIQQNTKC